jgi:hypothetical protein
MDWFFIVVFSTISNKNLLLLDVNMVKILSSFDTELKNRLYTQSVQTFWEENVILIVKSIIFLLITIWIPVFFYVLLAASGVILIYFVFYEFLDMETVFRIASAFAVLLLISVWISALYRYIDYTMSYFLITPKNLIMYKQLWIFTRQSKSVELTDVKSIKVDKKWIFNSLFDMWTIVFVLEWSENETELRIDYILSPEAMRERVVKIMNMDNHIHIA